MTTCNFRIIILVLCYVVISGIFPARSWTQSAKDSADLYYAEGKYGPALPFLDVAYNEMLQTQQWDSLARLTVKYANAIGFDGSYERAVSLIDSTYRIISETKSPERNQIRLLNSWGFTVRYVGDFDLAIELLNNALSLGQSTYDKPHAHQAKTHEYLAICHLDKNNFDSVRHHIHQAERINREVLGERSSEMGYFLNNAALVLDALNDQELALSYYLKALDILTQIEGENHPNAGIISNNIGSIYAARKQYVEALEFTGRALQIASDAADYVNEMNAAFNLGSYHIYLSEYDIGLPLLNRAQALCRVNFGEEHIFMSSIMDLMSEIMVQSDRYDKAIELSEKSFLIKQDYYGTDNLEIAQSYFTTANAHQKSGNLEHALILSKKGFQIRKRLLGSENTKSANSQYQMGEICLELGKLEQAEFYFQSVLRTYQRLPFTKTWQLDVYSRLGDLARMRTNFAESLMHYRQGLALMRNGESRTQDRHLVAQDLRDAPNLFLVIQGLMLGHFSYYCQDSLLNYNHLDSALFYGQLGVDYFNSVSTEYRETGAYIWANYSTTFYGYVEQIAYQAFQDRKEEKYIALAWEILSLIKYQSLRRGLQDRKAKNFAGIPIDVLNQEQELRQRLIQLENFPSDMDSSQRLMHTEQELAYQNFIIGLEKDYPKYFELKYKNDIPNIEEIQNAIDDSTQIIQYLMADNFFYVINLTTESVAFNMGRLDNGFHTQWIDSLMVGLLAQDCQQFATNSDRLSKLFFKPFIKESKPRIIVIPHGVLYQLNFEYFLVDKYEDGCFFEDLDYAIKHFNFRYVYLPEEITMSSSKSRGGWILAIAPGFAQSTKAGYLRSVEQDSSLQIDSNFLTVTRLPWSVETAENLHRMLRADLLIHADATEEKLKPIMGKYGVIHFGTHAEVDDDNPMRSHLILNKNLEGPQDDGYLHTHEIYAMPLQASMVSLTGCETGLGKFQTGEGMLSMARAFRYAGCPSVAMSLWKIDDQSSAEIMQEFYLNLKDEKTKDEAMRLAKLAFLSRSPSELSNPLYWAGMVLIGDVSPVNIQPESNLLMYAFLGFVAVVLVYFLSNNYQRKKIDSSN